MPPLSKDDLQAIRRNYGNPLVLRLLDEYETLLAVLADMRIDSTAYQQGRKDALAEVEGLAERLQGMLVRVASLSLVASPDGQMPPQQPLVNPIPTIGPGRPLPSITWNNTGAHLYRLEDARIVVQNQTFGTTPGANGL